MEWRLAGAEDKRYRGGEGRAAKLRQLSGSVGNGAGRRGIYNGPGADLAGRCRVGSFRGVREQRGLECDRLRLAAGHKAESALQCAEAEGCGVDAACSGRSSVTGQLGLEGVGLVGVLLVGGCCLCAQAAGRRWCSSDSASALDSAGAPNPGFTTRISPKQCQQAPKVAHEPPTIRRSCLSALYSIPASA